MLLSPLNVKIADDEASGKAGWGLEIDCASEYELSGVSPCTL